MQLERTLKQFCANGSVLFQRVKCMGETTICGKRRKATRRRYWSLQDLKKVGREEGTGKERRSILASERTACMDSTCINNFSRYCPCTIRLQLFS